MTNPDKTYNLSEMIAGNVFPWITGSDRQKYRRYAETIRRDSEGKDILGAARDHKGRNGHYLVKGRAIVEFINIFGPGLSLAKKEIKNDKRKKPRNHKDV